jgi:hypothetical protein
MIDHRSIIDNLQECLGMLCQFEYLFLAVNPDGKSLCYVSLGSTQTPGAVSSSMSYMSSVLDHVIRKRPPSFRKPTVIFVESFNSPSSWRSFEV